MNHINYCQGHDIAGKEEERFVTPHQNSHFLALLTPSLGYCCGTATEKDQEN